MNNYNNLYNASRTYNRILEKKYKKTKRKQLWKKRIVTAAMIGAMAVSLNTASDIVKSHQMKVNLMLDATHEMALAGYPTVPNADGHWDENHYLLNEIDMLKIYALMGETEAEKVLQSRGFASWDDFLQKQGFESRKDWRVSAINEYQEAEKARGEK